MEMWLDILLYKKMRDGGKIGMVVSSVKIMQARALKRSVDKHLGSLAYSGRG